MSEKCFMCGRSKRDYPDLVFFKSPMMENHWICSACVEYIYERKLASRRGNTEEKKQKIFISYSRKDKTIVETLAKVLSEFDFEVWYDRHLRYRGGADWWREVLNAVEDADVFIYAWSRMSAKSLNCLKELEWAETVKRTIIPIRIDTEVDDENLDPRLKKFADIQRLDYLEQSALEFSALVQSIRSAEVRILPKTDPDARPVAPSSGIVKLNEQICVPGPLSPATQKKILAAFRKQKRDVGRDPRHNQHDNLCQLLKIFADLHYDSISADTMGQIEDLQGLLGCKC